MDDRAFLTAPEVATLLRVHINTVLRWIGSGELAAFRFGIRYRIDVDDLDQFLETKRRSNDHGN